MQPRPQRRLLRRLRRHRGDRPAGGLHVLARRLQHLRSRGRRCHSLHPVNSTGLAQTVQLGPEFWLRIALRSQNFAHGFGPTLRNVCSRQDGVLHEHPTLLQGLRRRPRVHRRHHLHDCRLGGRGGPGQLYRTVELLHDTPARPARWPAWPWAVPSFSCRLLAFSRTTDRK